MSDPERITLGDLAIEVRSKNAGPFWVTIEAFMRDDAGYDIAEQLIDVTLIAALYKIPASDVSIFRIPGLRVIKASFPRAISQASLHDRDIHAGQHHVILARTPVPKGADPTGAPMAR